MGQDTRPRWSDAQLADVWTRVRAGDSFATIGRALGKEANTIRSVIAMRGRAAGRSRVACASTRRCARWWPRSSPRGGHHSRSRAGS